VSKIKTNVIENVAGTLSVSVSDLINVLNNAGTIQQAFTDVAQDQEVTITHTNDSLGKRIVQVHEYVAAAGSVNDTHIDFDVADESSFVTDDSNG
jgi:hypothetical protein